MDIKANDIHTLVEECVKHLQELGYSDACISVHQKRWKDGIIPYMEKCGTSSYTPEVGEEYLQYATKSSAPSTKRAIKRNVHILSDYLKKGTIRKRIVHLVNHPLPGGIGQVASEFLTQLVNRKPKAFDIQGYGFYFLQLGDNFCFSDKRPVFKIQHIKYGGLVRGRPGA